LRGVGRSATRKNGVELPLAVDPNVDPTAEAPGAVASVPTDSLDVDVAPTAVAGRELDERIEARDYARGGIVVTEGQHDAAAFAKQV
jgi:hypothetical protein